MENNAGQSKDLEEKHEAAGNGQSNKNHRHSEKHSRSRERSKSSRVWPGRRDSSSESSRSDHRHGRTKHRVEVIFPDLDEAFMSLREFLAIQKPDVRPEVAEKLYSKYQKDYEDRQVKTFFKDHKVKPLLL